MIETLNSVIPVSKTRVCVRHLYNNFKKQWPGKAYKDLVWAAARSYTEPEFRKFMEEIKNLDEAAYKYLMSQEPSTWSRHGFCIQTKCDMLLNNVCETFNSYILPAREMSVISMSEWIRRKLMNRFVSKRECIGKYKHMFTPYAIKVIEAAKEEGTRHCEVWWGGGNRYEVLRRGETDVVNIETKSCTCRKWELTGIPCAHAMACITKNRLQYDEYVDPFYSKETYLRTYNDIIQPMPGSNQYEVSGMVQPLPPKYIVQPGRPKKHARRREEGEEVPSKVKKIRIVGQTKCSNCGQPGHYRNKCSSPSMTPGSSGTKKQAGRPKNTATVVIGARKKKYIKKVTFQIFSTTTDKYTFCYFC